MLNISISRFCMIYIVLLAVSAGLKIFHMSNSLQIITASIKMSLQLIIAGLFLEYLFRADNPLFTFAYFCVMIGFTIYRILEKNSWMNRKFKLLTGISIAVTNFLIIGYFIVVVANQRLWDPQYVISIGGMILGNSMTANTLCLKSFHENLNGQRFRINALLCSGASPKKVLLPFVRQALDTASLPTINKMLSMGIVHLPGMMTGSILSGSVPFIAILYQIAVMVAICSSDILSCFCVLYIGQSTLIDHETQTINIIKTV